MMPKLVNARRSVMDPAVAWLQGAYADEHMSEETAREALELYMSVDPSERELGVDRRRGIRPFECVGVAQPYTLPQMRAFLRDQCDTPVDAQMSDLEFATQLPSLWPDAIGNLCAHDAPMDAADDVRVLLRLANAVDGGIAK